MGAYEAPLDDLLHIPVAIWVDPELDYITPFPKHPQRSDRHHRAYPGYKYEKCAGSMVLYRGEDSNRKAQGYNAYRASSGNVVPRFIHDRWHETYRTPPRPRREYQIFRNTVANALGYIGTRVATIGLNGAAYTVRARPEQRTQIVQHGLCWIDPDYVIPRYVLSYAITTNEDRLQKEIERLGNAESAAQYARFGELLIRRACDEAGAPLQGIVTIMRQQRQLPLNTPERAGDCLYNLATRDRQGNQYEDVLSWLGQTVSAPLPTELVAV